jgi:hypothetical protein
MANIPDDVKAPLNSLMDTILRSAGGTCASQGIDWATLWDQGIDSNPTLGAVSASSLSSATAATLPLLSSVADAGTAIRIAAKVDLTSGKILSIGDNNTTAYSEKAYFDFAGSLTCPNVYSGVTSASNNMRTDLLASYSSATLGLEGSIADSSSAIGVKIGNINTLSTSGAKILALYADVITTEKAYVDVNGFFGKKSFGTDPSGTGITASYGGGRSNHFCLKVVVDKSNFVTNGNNHDVTLWTVPAKTRVLRVVADITAGFTDGAGPITSMVLTVGKSAGGNTYLVGAAPIDAMSVGTSGLVLADAGTDLDDAYGDVPSWSAPTAISARFAADSPVATVGVTNLTAGSATFYIDCELYP